MCDCVFEDNWHVLPAELQRYFILMIANMQKPIYYHGFGVAILNLNTFVKVSNDIMNGVDVDYDINMSTNVVIHFGLHGLR